MGPAAGSRQGCRGEQREEAGLWCHGKDPWGCMGCPYHYVREATGTFGTYFSVLWKRSGGLYLNQITVNLKLPSSRKYSDHCNFNVFYIVRCIPKCWGKKEN